MALTRTKLSAALGLALLAGLAAAPVPALSAGGYLDPATAREKESPHGDWRLETPAWPFPEAGDVFLTRPAQNNRGSMSFRCAPGVGIAVAIAMPGPNGFRSMVGRPVEALITRMLQNDRVVFETVGDNGHPLTVTFMTDGFRSSLAQFRQLCSR